MFQAIYKERTDTLFEGKNVYGIRERLGYELAMHYRPQVDVVVPVPETARPIAQEYGWVTGVKVREGLVKNRYVSTRSFMKKDKESREAVVREKFSADPSIVGGKRVLVIEDSLVRGTTMRIIIDKLRKAGAKEVYVAFSCPPITDECPYGIDMYNKDLAARSVKGAPHQEICEKIAKDIGADGVYYNTKDSLVKALEVPERDLCVSCLTGVYVQPGTGTYMSEEERKR
jgi:amidophosphoribosyltransferase